MSEWVLIKCWFADSSIQDINIKNKLIKSQTEVL